MTGPAVMALPTVTGPVWLQIVGCVGMVAGAMVFVVAGVGLLRLRDVYERASAISTASGFGISLMLVGLWCWMPSWGNLFKLVAAVALQLLTSSVGSIALARAAYLTGSRMHNDGAMRRVVIKPERSSRER